MENWKLSFDSAGKSIFATGELGNLTKYDVDSTEILDTIRT